MSDSVPNVKTRKFGGIVALIGAGVMAAIVWAPWVGFGGETISGWDIHEQATGSQQWYINDMFDPNFSPFFPALPILIAAGVMALLALLLLSRLRLSKVGGGVVRLIGALVFLLAIIDPISVIQTDRSDIASVEWGLIGLAIGAFVAVLGLSVGSGVSRFGKKEPT